jgi:hypothetical protein
MLTLTLSNPAAAASAGVNALPWMLPLVAMLGTLETLGVPEVVGSLEVLGLGTLAPELTALLPPQAAAKNTPSTKIFFISSPLQLAVP